MNQLFAYCFNLLVHFMKKKTKQQNKTKPKQLTSPNKKRSVPLMIFFPQFSKRWKLGVGEGLPQFGLAVGFPCNAIFKKNPEQKQ